MLFLILFVATVVMVCVLLGVWSVPNLVRDARVRRTYHAVQPADAPTVEPESPEGVLTRKLIGGTITPTQYRHAIEGLAVRDEDRHPMAIPPEIGPPDA
jgi:hypothetical protein